MLWSYNHHSPCAVGVYYAAAGAFPGFDSGGLRDRSVCSEGAVEKKRRKATVLETDLQLLALDTA